MATLTGQTVAATYDLLLKVNTVGIDGTLRTIQDGVGEDSALDLSTGAVRSTGTLTVDGVSTLTGAVTAAAGVTGDLTGNADTATTATNVTVADTADATCFVGLFESATGNLPPKSDAGLTYAADTGTLTATALVGPLTGDVTGDASGSSGSCTGNAATATALAATGNIAMTGDVAWNVDFSGSGVTAAGTIQANAVDLSMLEDGTQGDILYYGASGAPARLGTGTAGQVLESGGAAANPSWVDSASGSQTVLTSGTTWTNSTNAKIIHVRLFGGGGGQGGGDNYLQVSNGKLGGRGASVTAVLDVSGETSVTYAIGSGGSGGAMGANNGSAGGDSTFGSNLTAGGGAGGGHYGGSVGANGSITTTEATAIDSTSDALRVVGKITYGISVAGTTTEGNGGDATSGAVVITVLG